MKKCTKCNEDKDLDQFSLHPGAKDGRNTQCKTCRNTYHKQNYDNDKRANRGLKHKYNIDLQEYEVLKKKQKDKCAICWSEAKLFVDHCHETGQIRGLLCHKCNTGIGLLEESIGNLENAIAYLSKI